MRECLLQHQDHSPFEAQARKNDGGLLKQEKRENIIAGINELAAARIATLAAKIKIQEPVMMTGGVTKNIGMVKALESRFKCQLLVTDSA